jgi:nitrogen-specific signal transduction histidine kinase
MGGYTIVSEGTGTNPVPAAVSEEELYRRLEAMHRVASALVHEIRNVLNPIVSAAYLLEAHAENPQKVRELAKRIEEFAKAEDRVAAKRRELLEREATAVVVEAIGEASGEAVVSPLRHA